MQPQSYANHRLMLKPSYLIAGLAIGAACVMLGYGFAREPSLGHAATFVLALGCAALWWSVRVADLRLQDRVIRAEMRARFERVLGIQSRADLERLTPKQVIALRFASDAELPALVAEALAGAEPDALKRKIRDWQGDHGRI